MEEIGRELREAREARGLSLPEVEKETRIRQRFLEAMEAGDREAVGGDVYLRGFLRNYGAFLGFNPESLVERAGLRGTQYEFGTTARLPADEDGYQPRYIEAPLRRNAFPFVRVLLLLLATLLVGGAALFFWGVNSTQRDAWLARVGITMPASPTATSPALPATATTTPIAPAATDNVATNATPTRSTRATAVPTATLPPRTPTPDPSTPTPEPTPTPPPTEPIKLIVQGVGPAWTEIYLEGSDEPVLYRTLQAGEQLQFEAQEELYLRCGNSAGLQLILNGQDLGVMGRDGGLSIRRWQRNPDGGAPLLVETLDQ